MRIEIENLTVKVTRDDGSELTFTLSDDGLATVTRRLVVQADVDGLMTLTVPFAAPSES